MNPSWSGLELSSQPTCWAKGFEVPFCEDPGGEVVEVGPELPSAVPPPIQPPRLCSMSSPINTDNTYQRVCR